MWGRAFPLARESLLLLSLVIVALSQVGTAVNNLAWISWMADLVREEIRGRYFGIRHSLLGGAALLATLSGAFSRRLESRPPARRVSRFPRTVLCRGGVRRHRPALSVAHYGAAATRKDPQPFRTRLLLPVRSCTTCLIR